MGTATYGTVRRLDMTAIADAIRAKGGASGSLAPSEMASAIAAIPAGGGGDFDGLVMRTITEASGSCSYIGSCIFSGCTSLSVASFPACIVISSNAFSGCTSLSVVSFPVCTNIGVNAFRSCTSLSVVSFPACTKSATARSMAANSSSRCSFVRRICRAYIATSSPTPTRLSASACRRRLSPTTRLKRAGRTSHRKSRRSTTGRTDNL